MKRTVYIAITAMLILVSIYVALVSCNGKQDANAPAFTMICQSRKHFVARNYEAARNTIMEMRMQYPAAIQARAAGVLLLDSIELAAARDSLEFAPESDTERLSLKCRFFERKLQEDLKKEILRQ